MTELFCVEEQWSELLSGRFIGAAVIAAFLLPATAQAHGAPAPRSAFGPQARSRAGSDVLAEADRWLGSGNMTGMAGPWCADAVSFWLRRTGHRPLANRMVASALNYGPRLSGPKVGALAVISTRRGWAGHVGVVEGIEPDGSIRVISGNWGRRVAHAIVPRRTIVAFVDVP